MIVALLQGRMSSSRLPGKVLKPLVGEPMIYRQIERIKRSKTIDKLIVATSTESSDDAIEQFCKARRIEYFRGDLNNVLSRYYHAALSVNATTVVRLTADCPVIDSNVIDAIVTKHVEEGNDYTSNTRPPTFPDGLDCEVIQFSVLEKAHFEATSDFDKEHVTPYITHHCEVFKVACYQNSEDLSHHRWTVDNPEDFALVEFIYNQLYGNNPQFSSEDIYALLDKHPEVYQLNRHLIAM